MTRIFNKIKSVWNFYIDGFKNMTWERPLWILILLKLIILFAILRVFFFKPVLGGKTEEQRSEFVGEQLINQQQSITNQQNK